MYKEISNADRKTFVEFWARRKKIITGKVSENTMKWFKIYTDLRNIGYEFGELRPGKLGQWDLYGWLIDPEINICSKDEAMLVTGLTMQEITEQERRDHLENHGVDPDNLSEIAYHEMLQDMSPRQIKQHISKLEKHLGLLPL